MENALSVPVAAIQFTPAAGTPMMDMRKMPRPEKPKRKFSDSDDFGPPPGMQGGPMGGGVSKKRSSSTQKLVGKGVWINMNGKAAFRPVKTGLNDGVNVQILAGLAEGDSVVVRQESAAVVFQSSDGTVSPFMPGPRKKKK